MVTVEELAVRLDNLNRRLDGKVSKDVFDSETSNLKEDVRDLKGQVNQIIANQITGQRTAVFQLIGIIVTLVVAAVGVFLR